MTYKVFTIIMLVYLIQALYCTVIKKPAGGSSGGPVEGGTGGNGTMGNGTVCNGTEGNGTEGNGTECNGTMVCETECCGVNPCNNLFINLLFALLGNNNNLFGGNNNNLIFLFKNLMGNGNIQCGTGCGGNTQCDNQLCALLGNNNNLLCGNDNCNPINLYNNLLENINNNNKALTDYIQKIIDGLENFLEETDLMTCVN